jgi:hypothetical protein
VWRGLGALSGSLSPMLSIRNRTRLTPAGQPACLPAWVVRPAQSSQVQCNKPFSLSFSKETWNAVEFLVERSRMYVQLEMILVYLVSYCSFMWRNKYMWNRSAINQGFVPMMCRYHVGLSALWTYEDQRNGGAWAINAVWNTA